MPRANSVLVSKKEKALESRCEGKQDNRVPLLCGRLCRVL